MGAFTDDLPEGVQTALEIQGDDVQRQAPFEVFKGASKEPGGRLQGLLVPHIGNDTAGCHIGFTGHQLLPNGGAEILNAHSGKGRDPYYGNILCGPPEGLFMNFGGQIDLIENHQAFAPVGPGEDVQVSLAEGMALIDNNEREIGLG